MDSEIAFILILTVGKDEAEESFSDAGEVVVVLHAVCRQGGSVDCDTEAVLHIEGVHAGAVEGHGEDVPLDGGFRDIREASGCRSRFLQIDNFSKTVRLQTLEKEMTETGRWR